MLFIGKHRTEFPAEVSVSRLQIGDEWYAEVIARDITDRESAEDRLKERDRELSRANALLEETGRMAGVGGWEFDVDTGKQVWTPEVYRIHEVDPDFEPTVEKGISFYAPEAVPIISKAVQRAIEEGEPFDVELRFITAKGNERWVHTIGEAERVGGQTVKVRGTFQDVTDRKAAEEELRLTQFAVDHSADSVFWVTSEGKIIYANEEACRRRGYTREEMLSLEIFDINDSMAADRGLWESTRERIQQEGHFTVEFRHRTKGGEVFPVEAALNFFDLEGGWLFVANVRDITDRKQAEEELRRSVEKYRTLFDNMMEGFAFCRMVYDDDGNPVDWFYLDTNKAFEPLTGLENVIGKYATEIMPGIKETNPESFEIHGRVASTGRPEQFEVRVVPLSRDLLIKTFCPLKGYFVSVFEDITERKQAEKDLKRVNLELEGYAHTVSHGLKGPTSTASLAFEMLMSEMEKGGVPQEKAEQLREIIEAGLSNMSNVHNIIENLLVLAEAGEPQDVSPVSIEDMIDRVLAENAEMINEKGIAVEVASPLGSVVASPTQIYQLFSNLIRNSIEHNKAENPAVEISSLGVNGATHRFLVRDNGQGIPEEVLDDVFMPFVKAQSSGSGIGLSIVEKVVETYGGEIKAYNDNGACFEFTLPIDSSQGP